ncbi:MAG: hypothetical protein U9N51_11485 [Bacteroidota bacterium]|nr:hypothetical protein [Bacteroidota bacterium]
MQNTRQFLVLIFLFGLAFLVQGQVLDVQYDHHGNKYVLKENRLEKINAEGKLISVYDLPQTSYVTGFDVSNPMRILVFSSGFNTVLFLDNYLSEISDAILLDNYDYYNSLLACTAARGGFWIFDGTRNQIVHIDPLGNQDLKSGEIETSGKPIFLQEYERQLFLSYDSGNLLIFNGYAGFVKTLPLAFLGRPVVKNDCVYYIKDRALFCYDLNRAESKEIMSIPVPIKRFSIYGDEFVYLFKGNLNRSQMR